MKYDFIQGYCLSKKGSEEDYKKEWDTICFSVRGKIFALIGNDNTGKPIISLKHTPEQGMELRKKYKDITPGYYLNKTLWSSVFLSGNIPETALKQMLDVSYELIFNSLSKKIQNEITNQ
ncbi:MmcQ/YjbR family DNA-binding protein [Chryseobacterium sp.]|uniref:MmcQ/YjbR family DNA-binding protein n=1 Tax=Chryseobacterium sp. TaxID=1871047 RepID=UPI0025BA0326|nr:MmcQ/YjbR family DNA-binding protein [Chryseobacterium sp.]